VKIAREQKFVAHCTILAEEPQRVKMNYPACSSVRKNPEFFYLPHFIKFANFEFIFVIRGPKLGPKLAERSTVDKVIKYKIVFLFTCTFEMTSWRQAKGVSSPSLHRGHYQGFLFHLL